MAHKPKTRRKKAVPMSTSKPVSQSRVRKELDPRQKPGAAHAEKRQKMLMKKKKVVRRTG